MLVGDGRITLSSSSTHPQLSLACPSTLYRQWTVYGGQWMIDATTPTPSLAGSWLSRGIILSVPNAVLPSLHSDINPAPNHATWERGEDTAASRLLSRLRGLKVLCALCVTRAKDVIDDCACQFSTRRCDGLSSAVREGGSDRLCSTASHRQTPAPFSSVVYAEMRPGLCAEKPAGNRRHRRQGPAATDASLSHLFLSRLPPPELSVLPRAGRKICHAILASLSPAKKAGAPKGVAAIFRCRWRRSSIMAGCSGQDGDDEGILFRNELDAPPSRTVASTSRHGKNRSGPNNSGRRTFSRPHTRHLSLPQSGLGLEGGMGCGGGGGGERGAKFPRFPAVPASSPCSQHDFVSLLCVEISGTASSLSRAMFHHHHQPSPRLAVCIVDASTPLSI